MRAKCAHHTSQVPDPHAMFIAANTMLPAGNAPDVGDT